MTEIAANGTVHQLLWAPFTCEVPLKAGENTIAVTLTNSCRNLFGPHYNQQCDLYNAWPGGFSRDTEEMYFVRFGIEDGIELLF